MIRVLLGGGFVGVWFAAAAQMAPLVLPWDDRAAGVTDASGFNRPIDEARRVRVDEAGHFQAGGERVRFLGVNFAGDAPFMPTNKAAAVAARLAKFGVNCMRFHHIDAPWATGGGVLRYSSTSSRAINESQLERIHYLVAQLRERGVYANVNLLTGREYRSGDGLGASVAGLDAKVQHVLACFNDTALELQKEFATRLLAPTNRFTGLPLARDPAVALVEILNENGLLQKWYDGALDALPPPFAGQLEQRWNTWLAGRYASEAELLTGWQAVRQPLGTNRLKNGNFSVGLTSWSLEQHETAAATVMRTAEFNGAGSARLTVTRASSASWHVQFNQPGLPLTGGQVYTLTFSAKANAPGPLDFSVMLAHDPWQPVGLGDSVGLTTNWQTFTRTFVATSTDANTRVNFGGIGSRLVTVWLADVRLQPGGELGVLPAGTSLAAGTVPAIRHGSTGFTGTTSARRDWIRFAVDLESRYYDAMVGHLRTNIGYPGLLMGTIMANSPLAVQTRLDVIDAHAYWQHPVFPGTAWDPNNWYVPNVSLLNAAPGETTIAGLARQRVRGKPFTVTEYQHPSPNSFGAEGPLVLAAYAALQDWDGVWLFDYGWGNDAAQGSEPKPMGRYRGYFDTGQHPTKMANLRAAANLFRRADVRPAARAVTMALKPDQELELLLRRAGAWSVFNLSQLDLPGALALVDRVEVAYGPEPTGLATAPGAPVVTVSDTGELDWQASSTAGVLKIQTPRSRGVVGFTANRAYTLGDVGLRLGTNALGWATVMLTLVEGTDFTGGGRALLVGTGQCENTGQQWTSAAHTSLSSWGHAPTLVETVPMEVSLPVVAQRVRAWILDERGQRRGAAEVRAGGSGNAVVVTHATDATIWYEIEIAAAEAASFDRWRVEQFTVEELARVDVSGPEAAPAGDGVPNFVKYALALPPKVPARATDLARWGIEASAGGRVFWLTYTRRKNGVDFVLRALAGRGVWSWTEVPSTVIREVGEVQMVRVEHSVADETPVGFLRLELSRLGGAGPGSGPVLAGRHVSPLGRGTAGTW